MFQQSMWQWLGMANTYCPIYYVVPAPNIDAVRSNNQVQAINNSILKANQPDTVKASDDSQSAEAQSEKVGMRQYGSSKAAIVPRKKIIRDQEYKVKAQSSNRNIFSNLYRHMLYYIRNSKEVKNMVARIIEINKLTVTIEDYERFIQGIRLSNYTRMKTAEELWFGSSQIKDKPKEIEQIRKIFRILSNIYLRRHGKCSVVLARKIRSENKEQHLKKIREVQELLHEGRHRY